MDSKQTGRIDEHKVYIVTGAGRGIGRAIAYRFVQDGHRVLAVDQNANDLSQLELDCPREGAIATLVQDVTDDGAPDLAVSVAVDRFEQLDGLVNNAGIAGATSLDLTEDQDYDRFVDVMLRSAFRYSRSMVRYLGERPGSIVHISSVFGIVGSPQSSAYAAAKAGLIGLTKQMAVDYGPRGIRTNAVAPGLIATPMTQQRLDSSERFRRVMVDTTPSARIGRPEDIAAAVAFLSSRDAEFINGHLLVVDGGWSVTNHVPPAFSIGT